MTSSTTATPMPAPACCAPGTTGALHPRPQLTRERWCDLSGTWAFGYDDADVGRQERWPERTDVLDRQIEVPFPPESERSGIGERGFHPVVWYRRSFRTGTGGQVELTPGERLLLHFGAVDYRAEVWVNGQHVVSHEGGHVPFDADITDLLHTDGEQVVVVRAEDQPTDAYQPRGKQDVRLRPHNIWYERTTGIWQPVWLEPVPAHRVRGVRWTSDLEQGTLRAQVDLQDVPAGWRVGVRVALRERCLVEDTYRVPESGGRTRLTRTLELPRAEMGLDRDGWLWSPEHPNLLDVDLTLTDEAGTVVDRVGSYVGFRSVGTTAGRFTLNGRPYHLRLVLAQNYWPTSHLAAPDADGLRREVELVKELGFNGIRLHQKVEDPRFLHWCDRLGVVVWAELPAAFGWSDVAVRRSAREWLEVLERDVSVPSIIAWVPVNESWGVPGLQHDPAQRHFVQAMYSLAKALDPTRPVVGNDGWEHVVTDLVTVHDYAGNGQTLRDRYGSVDAAIQTLGHVQPQHRPVLLPGMSLAERPLILSEFGGVSYQAGEDFWNGYGIASDEEDFVARYRDVLDAVLESPVLAGFCYTQLTDTGQERNGLLTEDRQPKADLALLRAITERHSAAVPADVIEDNERQQRRAQAGAPELDGVLDPH